MVNVGSKFDKGIGKKSVHRVLNAKLL